MAHNSFNVKRGPVAVLFGVLFTLIFGTFVLTNDKAIIAQLEREKLTPEEILLVAQEQYKLEKRDRLELLGIQDEQLCIATERINKLESDLCEYKQQQIALYKQITYLRQTTSSSGGRGAGYYEPSSYQEVNGKMNLTSSGNPTTYYQELQVRRVAQSMNKADFSQLASYHVDPSGKPNILYFDKRKKMFTYLYPVVMPSSVAKTPQAKSKKQVTSLAKKETSLAHVKQKVASQGKGRGKSLRYADKGET